MREVKFQAYVNHRLFGIGVFEVVSIHFHPFVCEVQIGDERVNFFDFDEIKLRQYTGLKDKNGKEIYEGDIVKYDDWKPKEVFYEGGYGFMGFRLKNTELFLMGYDSRHYEVIGNIYENPELLES